MIAERQLGFGLRSEMGRVKGRTDSTTNRVPLSRFYLCPQIAQGNGKLVVDLLGPLAPELSMENIPL